MTLEQIKEQLAGLPQEHQDHVAAYLAHLRHSRDPFSARKLAAKIDDKDPSHWVSLDTLKENWKD